MRTETTRQTRWAAGPGAVDPEQVPPGSTYVREVVWAPCTECDLQVHATCRQWIAAGIVCPECGRTLALAPSAEDGEAAMRKVSAEESRFRDRSTS